jgi:hypothetical protein
LNAFGANVFLALKIMNLKYVFNIHFDFTKYIDA